MRAHFVLRSFLSVTVFLVVHSSARPTNSSTASEASGITWISPQADHVYHPGDLIHLQWFIGEGTNSPNYFGMCVGNEAVSESGGPQRPHSSAVDSAVEEETAAGLNAQLKPAPSSIARRSDQSSTCGDRIWAKPHHNGSVYSLMFTAPNATSAHKFFLQSYHGKSFVGASPSFSLLSDTKVLYHPSPKFGKASIIAITVPCFAFLAIALLACVSSIRDRRAAGKAAKAAKDPNRSRIVLDDPFAHPKPVHLPSVDREPRPIAPRLTSSIRHWRLSFVSRGDDPNDRTEADVEKALSAAPCEMDPYTTVPERAERWSSRWSSRWSAIHPTDKHSSTSFSDNGSHYSTPYDEACGSSALVSPASSTPRVHTADRARMQLPRLVVPRREPGPPLFYAFSPVGTDTMTSYYHASSVDMDVQEPILPTPVAMSPTHSLPLPQRPRSHPHALTASARMVPGVPPDPVMVRLATLGSLHATPRSSPTKPVDLYARVQQALTSPRSPLRRE